MHRRWLVSGSGSTRAAAGLLALALVALVVAGCGSDKAKTTTKPPAASPSGTSGTSGTSPEGTAPNGTAVTSVWTRTAVAYRGQNGKRFQLTCTAHGTQESVWGTGPYTDDSSICTAAVQSGLITFAKGGTVTYQIAPGQDSYKAGSAHGVASGSYASWPGSFTLPDATGTIATGPESWSEDVTSYRGQNGKQITVACSANGTTGSVWGSGPFTDDSSVCTAAVFAGLITTAKGGSVVATIAPGQKSYKGGTAHGVTTSDYGDWTGSFTLSSS